MLPKFTIEFFVYALVIVLSIIIFVLLMVSPAAFTETKSVYQGF
jgi:hypothetical protein